MFGLPYTNDTEYLLKVIMEIGVKIWLYLALLEIYRFVLNEAF